MHDHLPNIATVVAKFASALLFPPLRFFKTPFYEGYPKMCLFETGGSSGFQCATASQSPTSAPWRSPFHTRLNKVYLYLKKK